MMYSVGDKWIPTEELIGKFIEWNNIKHWIGVSGEILDVIPARTMPTEEKIIDFYGKNYPKGVLRPLNIDRVKVYATNKHHFVLPLSDKVHFEIGEK